MVLRYQEDILQDLLASPAILSFSVLRQESGQDSGFLRVKCFLADKGVLELSEYIEARIARIHVETYSYHWQDASGRLVKRWDNVPHHRELSTFPHHLHLENGKVVESPAANLKKVLKEIEKAVF